MENLKPSPLTCMSIPGVSKFNKRLKGRVEATRHVLHEHWLSIQQCLLQRQEELLGPGPEERWGKIVIEDSFC